jgi:transposase
MVDANKKRRVFDKAFKLHAVRLIEEEGLSQEEVAVKLDVGRTVISRWVKAYRASPEEAFPGEGRPRASQAEMLRMRRELKEAQDERDILKKALAIFSRPNRDDSPL